jgi:predicted nucleic acid-binding protein
LVIADTSPINYLIQIHQIELLPRLFERVALPSTVQSELSHVRAPLPVQEWIANPPGWLEIHATPDVTQVALEGLALEGLDEGETAAIALAEALHADLLLIDEREGFRIAMRRGLPATGTLGVLDLAAERGLVDFAAAITALERTSFRLPATLLKILLAKHKS